MSPAPRRGAVSHEAAWLAPLMLTLLLAGCGPEERQADTATGGTTASIQTTADQVNRSRKRDALQRVALNEPAFRPPAPQAPRFRPYEPRPSLRHVPDGSTGLRRFYAVLADLESGARREPVTILHLGDSHIASDRFTGDLRALFQERFGDAGRGLLMPGFPFAYYRANGVRFAKGGQWSASSSLVNDPGPYGLTGVRLATSEAGAYVRLTSEAGAFEWAEATFVVGPGQGTAIVSVDDAEQTIDTKAGKPAVKTVRLQYKGTHLTVRAKGDGAVSLLSWRIGQDKPGIRYVNLGIPSASMAITERWDDAAVAADLERLKPELIVLGYGTNEGFDDRLDIDDYERRYAALIKRLRRYAPAASFVVIGPADGARFPSFARKGRGMTALKDVDCRPLEERETQDYLQLVSAGDARLARWYPPPNLGRVRAALKRTAARAGAHYWDWSTVMGGACGIRDWVLAEPSLATSDHVHITAAGSRRSAKVLFADLMSGFADYGKLASR